MKKEISQKSQTDWNRLLAMTDEEIDLTEIPEVTPEMFARAAVMKRSNQRPKQSVRERRDPIDEYLAELEKFYPAAIGSAHVHKQPDNQMIVCIALPERVNERMRLFDQMAEVATKILIETDQLIILSSQ